MISYLKYEKWDMTSISGGNFPLRVYVSLYGL